MVGKKRAKCGFRKEFLWMKTTSCSRAKQRALLLISPSKLEPAVLLQEDLLLLPPPRAASGGHRGDHAGRGQQQAGRRSRLHGVSIPPAAGPPSPGDSGNILAQKRAAQPGPGATLPLQPSRDIPRPPPSAARLRLLHLRSCGCVYL